MANPLRSSKRNIIWMWQYQSRWKARTFKDFDFCVDRLTLFCWCCWMYLVPSHIIEYSHCPSSIQFNIRCPYIPSHPPRIFETPTTETHAHYKKHIQNFEQIHILCPCMCLCVCVCMCVDVYKTHERPNCVCTCKDVSRAKKKTVEVTTACHFGPF